MNEWTLSYEGFDPGQERLREALCTLRNGYFAPRGAAEEATANVVHYPGTYGAEITTGWRALSPAVSWAVSLELADDAVSVEQDGHLPRCVSTEGKR